MATKEQRRFARVLLEELETRVHAGPPIGDREILSAQAFLRENDFPPSSDYFNRLQQVQQRLDGWSRERTAPPPAKRNYGGAAADTWVQVQSAFDHVILSTCHEGDCHFQHGRIKISHRFNEGGRIDFVELKFLRSLHSCLNGEIRALLTVKDYRRLAKGWHAAEAFVLPLLPKELVFLAPEFFHCPRGEGLAWLVNIGHRIASDLEMDLKSRPLPEGTFTPPAPGSQWPIEALPADEVAWPILHAAAALECAVELNDPKTAQVRYLSR
jgi:hypothetical protein